MTLRTGGGVPARPSREAGFSLIEVVVALALLSAILAALPGAFGLARRASDRVGDIDRRDGWAASRSFIEQRLAEALPILLVEPDGVRRPAFSGTASRLAFVAPSAAGPAGGGLYRWSLAAGPAAAGGAGERALVLGHLVVAGGRIEPQRGETRSLLDGIGGVRLRYFGRRGEHQERGWHDDWPDGTTLPELVSLSLTEPDDIAAAVPADRHLVVPLRLGRR